MIDDIVEMILKEARARKGKDLVGQINSVMNEATTKIMGILDNIREEERREKEDEDKRANSERFISSNGEGS